MVVSGRDLHHIGAANIELAESAKDGQYLGACRPTGHRRTGSGRKGWIEAIDIEGQISGHACRVLDDQRGDIARPHFLHLVTVENADAEILRRMGANTDLDGTIGIDQTIAHGACHEGTMVNAFAVVEPGILMRIEMHQRQRAVLCHMRLQQRPGDEMVAAKRQQIIRLGDDLARFLFDCIRRFPVIAVVEQAVAIIDGRHMGEKIAGEGILRVVVENRGGAADRLRPEACTRPVGCRRIEGDTPDGRRYALEDLGIFAPHEGEDTRMGRVGRSRCQRCCGEGMVDGF
ncbi:hypothetical protein D3C87_1395890 [compost metagenome]